MVALKGRDIEAFLRRPDRSIVLVYGPDTGLVSERSAAILKTAETDGDPLAQVTMDGDALAADPQRLVEEAWTPPLFGGKRAIRVTASSRDLMPALKPLLDDPPSEALVVVEGRDMKRSSPLRKAFEAAKTAVALPCYLDGGRDLEQLIDEEEARSGLSFTPDARAAIQRLTGGDRLASRAEIAKVALYCHGVGEVTVEDVAAVAGDASAVALDELADAVGLGEAALADRALRRIFAEGAAPGSVILALGRHFRQLAEMRGRIDDGATAESALKSLKPPVFYKREQAVRRQATLWSAEQLARVGAMLLERELETRRMPDLGEAIVGRCVLTLAQTAAARR